MVENLAELCPAGEIRGGEGLVNNELGYLAEEISRHGLKCSLVSCCL